MNSLRILTTAQIRFLESDWIKTCHENWGLVLMELAGLEATKYLLELMEGMPASVTALCGQGNNGGDGLVIARHLYRFGITVSVFMIGQPASNNFSACNKTNSAILEKLGVKINYISDNNLESVKNTINASSAVVDALLGTGLDRQVDGLLAKLINLVNDSNCPVMAVDVPSGINSDTGQIMGAAIRATACATFGSLKPGLLCYPGAELAGELRLIDIGLPMPGALPENMKDSFPELEIPTWWLVGVDDVAKSLPLRPVDSHKGTFGQILFIAGSLNMPGAAMFAASTSLRAGAGLAILATPHSCLRQLPPQEIIYHGLPETEEGTISIEALSSLEQEMERAQVVVIGPGLSHHSQTVQLVQELVKKVRVPCVVDADGLNAIAQNPKILKDTEGGLIFTPHPKELSKLMGKSVEDIQADRIRSACEAAKRFGAVIVLKGAHTVIATPDDDAYVISTGNSGMATAGSGDVLTGIIARFAVSMDKTWAAVAGAYIHGVAGDMAACELGEDGTIAGDIMDYVPCAIKAIRDGKYGGSDLEKCLDI